MSKKLSRIIADKIIRFWKSLASFVCNKAVAISFSKLHPKILMSILRNADLSVEKFRKMI